jgi:hypothetical protein
LWIHILTLIGLTSNKDLNLMQLAELVDKLPDSEGKQAFIQWIQSGRDQYRGSAETHHGLFSRHDGTGFCDISRNARSFVIILSIAVTVLFGTDSIQLARTLWTNAELRALAVAKAEMVVQQEGTDATIDDLIKELGDMTIKIGWWQTERPASGSDATTWDFLYSVEGIGAWLNAVAAVSQGSSFWYDLLKKITSPATSTSSSRSSGGESSSSSKQ